MYYNTLKAKGLTLKSYVKKSKSQYAIIYAMIKDNKPFTPSSIFLSYPCSMTPITSIRRTISDMKGDLLVEETGNRKAGLYGRREYELKLI